MAASACRLVEQGLFSTAYRGGLLRKCQHVNLISIRGIKKVPKKPKRKDGHHTTSYNLFWEDRQKNIPKPPLWVEPTNNIKNTPSNKKSTGFSVTEKRLAAAAVLSMITAVIAFKMVFGKKHERVPAESDDTKVLA